MLFELIAVAKRAFMITGFVFVMMLLIEYINVQTQGLWQDKLLKSRWKQYLLSAILGVIPGCLGAFTAVTLFSHGMLSFGSIVTAMIATSGDEAFVMLAMFPKQAILLTVILFFIAVLAGMITDKLYKPKKVLLGLQENSFPLHKHEQCKCFKKDKFLQQLIKPSAYRLVLSVIVLSLLFAVLFGFLAGNAKLWIRISLLLTIGFSLFVVTSVPDHFLEKHLWGHILKKHIPRVFLWTFGTLLVFAVLMHFFDIKTLLSENMILILIIAVLIGIIPESGPHLVFVSLFAEGLIPFSVLLASSISQDGHGSLPLLAESKRGFIAVKIVNIIVALLIGFSWILIENIIELS